MSLTLVVGLPKKPLTQNIIHFTASLYNFEYLVFQVANRSDAHLELNSFRRKGDHALIIKGDSLDVC